MMHRWNQHCAQAVRLSTKWRSHFCCAIRAHGKHAFSHEVLEVCDSLEAANLSEKKWIWVYDTQNPMRGFNLMKGGEHVPHPIKNPWDRPEYRSRSIDAINRRVKNPLVRQANSSMLKAKWSDPSYRYKHSEELRKLANRPEAKTRLADMNKRRVWSPEAKARVSAASVGHVCGSETKAKISAANRNCSSAARAKISEANKKRMRRPESMEKARKSMLEYWRKRKKERVLSAGYE